MREFKFAIFKDFTFTVAHRILQKGFPEIIAMEHDALVVIHIDIYQLPMRFDQTISMLHITTHVYVWFLFIK